MADPHVRPPSVEVGIRDISNGANVLGARVLADQIAPIAGDDVDGEVLRVDLEFTTVI